MSDSIPIPDILNQVARAGRQGRPLGSNPSSLEMLDLCRRHGFRLTFQDGRAFLPFDKDALVPAWIEQETPAIAWKSTSVRGFLEIGSTNERALELARRGSPDGTLIFAEMQTAGKGRRGRRWSSLPGGGIYCTLIVRPSQPQLFWPLLTHTASVSLVEALKETMEECRVPTVPSLELKWPNDVLLSGKKTAGILLEIVPPGRFAGAVVVGVGVNVRRGSVPEELREQATCVSGETGTEVPRRLLLVRFLYHFQLWYGLFERGERRALLDGWMDRSSMWNGVPVWIEDGCGRRRAMTCGLTDLGALRIRNADGAEETLMAGDVSICRA
jgi:BirA family transcriptional regulator, biotin operon repressor / biotin---[acetyl-CoA-carboxylase] ligase